MKLKSLSILICFMVFFFVFVGCEKADAPLALKAIGPVKTMAGVGFNIQPGGGSAMWANTENATKTTVIVWEDKPLRTDYKSPELLTAPVPSDLYAAPGQYQVTLLDTKTNVKSNSIFLTVE